MDPKRLTKGGGLGATLLASARTEAPAAGARDRTAMALGISVAAATALTAANAAAAATGASTSIAPGAVGAGAAGAGAAGAGAGAAGAGAAGAAVKVGVTALWIKIAASSVIAATVAGGVVATSRDRGVSKNASAVATTTPTVLATGTYPSARTSSDGTRDVPPVPPVVAEATPTATPHIDNPRTLPEPTKVLAPSAKPVTATPKNEVPVESPLARELGSLDEARAAFARGDATAALAALDRHDRAFPRGTMRPEADVLRAEALLASGQTSAARALAEHLLARDPSGPHARRLRTISGDVANP